MTSGSAIPAHLHYTKTHEWVKVEGGQATVGITDHAQAELTDVVFVDLPPVGKEGKPGEPLMVLESVKTVADVYAPFAGKVAAVNAELKNHPEWVNKDPYGQGWLYKLEIAGSKDLSGFLSAEQYQAHVASGAH